MKEIILTAWATLYAIGLGVAGVVYALQTKDQLLGLASGAVIGVGVIFMARFWSLIYERNNKWH